MRLFSAIIGQFGALSTLALFVVQISLAREGSIFGCLRISNKKNSSSPCFFSVSASVPAQVSFGSHRTYKDNQLMSSSGHCLSPCSAISHELSAISLCRIYFRLFPLTVDFILVPFRFISRLPINIQDLDLGPNIDSLIQNFRQSFLLSTLQTHTHTHTACRHHHHVGLEPHFFHLFVIHLPTLILIFTTPSCASVLAESSRFFTVGMVRRRFCHFDDVDVNYHQHHDYRRPPPLSVFHTHSFTSPFYSAIVDSCVQDAKKFSSIVVMSDDGFRWFVLLLSLLILTSSSIVLAQSPANNEQPFGKLHFVFLFVFLISTKILIAFLPVSKSTVFFRFGTPESSF